MRALIRPDDEVYRVDAVWLGPRGFTLPWSARYSAYGIWLMLFVSVLLVEAALPMRVNVPPVWEIVLTILATYALTGVIDHDRPPITVWELLRVELGAPRRRKRADRPVRLSATSIRVRELHVQQEGA
ncbi:hypothetical protein FB382_003737 [Nocardioides ginsengisegetis]|uniref:TcpE family protein n=1 Tax=Nocardioides ginsengisegetis TaxID=661491 RepID=A0A7W3J365_9ACTN|nr:hypothetical protein [Nocardioides ginsengisegetis]MBA8805446.1 hypothetical protein [Nocardioides ginsengisegetis]